MTTDKKEEFEEVTDPLTGVTIKVPKKTES